LLLKQRKLIRISFFLFYPNPHNTDVFSEEQMLKEEMWVEKTLTAVSRKNLFGGLRRRCGCSIRLAHRFPPRPAPILGRENISRLGHFLRFARFWARTCVLSQPLRSFCGMTSLTPTSTFPSTHRSASGRADPSDLLFLTLRSESSAYLASERFVVSSETPDPEPPPAPALRALPTPRRTPRLIVGQALDRMAA
jgi:hypothetical protein